MSTSPRDRFLNTLRGALPFTPTKDQSLALEALTDFIGYSNPHELFLLKGYAGTGKTSLIQALVETLPLFKRQCVLLAPTGRAAKVITQYSQQKAFTIHRHIYRLQTDGRGRPLFTVRPNRARHTLFIVDEASMIADQPGEHAGSLLDDLLQFAGSGYNCRLLLVGDTAQLPPVHTSESPALDADYLARHYSLEAKAVELTEVMRQQAESTLLKNATALRQLQVGGVPYAFPQFICGSDLIRLQEGFEVEEALNEALSEVGREETVIITRSNKRANLYNQQMRQRVLWQEDEISSGDLLMVVKNNYHWLPNDSSLGFIANGDIVELLEIYELPELYGRRFGRVKLRFIDHPSHPSFEAIIFLDTLDYPGPSLPYDELRQFYQVVLQDYADIPNRKEQLLQLKNNPYANALQVKFASALTCHKAQGGQWSRVFIEHPWRPEEEIDLDYLRWLYTALTRAKERVYLMGFPDTYFSAGS
jgi:exodeoxyribonuclease-5